MIKRIGRAWKRFWFESSSPEQMGLFRVLVGTVMLCRGSFAYRRFGILFLQDRHDAAFGDSGGHDGFAVQVELVHSVSEYDGDLDRAYPAFDGAGPPDLRDSIRGSWRCSRWCFIFRSFIEMSPLLTASTCSRPTIFSIFVSRIIGRRRAPMGLQKGARVSRISDVADSALYRLCVCRTRQSPGRELVERGRGLDGLWRSSARCRGYGLDGAFSGRDRIHHLRDSFLGSLFSRCWSGSNPSGAGFPSAWEYLVHTGIALSMGLFCFSSLMMSSYVLFLDTDVVERVLHFITGPGVVFPKTSRARGLNGARFMLCSAA